MAVVLLAFRGCGPPTGGPGTGVSGLPSRRTRRPRRGCGACGPAARTPPPPAPARRPRGRSAGRPTAASAGGVVGDRLGGDRGVGRLLLRGLARRGGGAEVGQRGEFRVVGEGDGQGHRVHGGARRVHSAEGLHALRGELRGCLGDLHQALGGLQPLGGEGDQWNLLAGEVGARAVGSGDVGVERALAILDRRPDSAQPQVQALGAGEAHRALERGRQLPAPVRPFTAREAEEGAAVLRAGREGPLALGDVAGDVLPEGAAHSPVDGAVRDRPG